MHKQLKHMPEEISSNSLESFMIACVSTHRTLMEMFQDSLSLRWIRINADLTFVEK